VTLIVATMALVIGASLAGYAERLACAENRRHDAGFDHPAGSSVRGTGLADARLRRRRDGDTTTH